jgi:superfamily II DNA/RNA helicase
MPRSLIIEPTRELAAQVAAAFDTYGKHHKLSQALLIGGESFSDQERKLDRGVDVLIATPGRLLDLYERGKIILSDTKILVIDEADRMLDMGFIPDVERIVSLLPRIRQTLFFSATMPPEIRRLADAFLLNPKEVTVAPPASPAKLVAQNLVTLQPFDKREALRRLLRAEDVKNALIFCNRKRDVDILYRSLVKHGFNAAALHGDMTQSVRTETLEKFKEGAVQLLVASDVAARGLDIQGLSHVFNFDVPIHAEDYVHRIGRTGRAGRGGKAFMLATPEDGHFVASIVALIGNEIPPFTMDGMEAAALDAEAPDRRTRGRRGGSGRSRGTGERPAPAPRAAAKPPREQQPPRDRQPRPENRSENRNEPRHAPPPRNDRPAAASRPAPAPISMENFPLVASGVVTPMPARRPEPHYADDDHKVVGFGDNPPAFLSRPRAKLA